jgi:FkbM family methyltransferase
MFTITDESVKKVRQFFTDEKSLSIYDNRIMYSLTGDNKYINKMVSETLNDTKVYKNFKHIEGSPKRKAIFGTGAFGNLTFERFQTIKWDCFIDNFPKGETHMGLDVYTCKDYIEKFGPDNTIYYITSFPFGEQMKMQLMEFGVKEEDIFNFFREVDWFEEHQYFDYWQPRDVESFVDAGAFNGMSSQIFMNWCNNNYSNIWVFEPDSKNFGYSTQLLSQKPNVKLYNSGVYSKTSERVKFFSGWEFGCRLSEDGNSEINTIALDDLLGQEKVTFIKMDIEGAEYDALLGAKKLIREQKPRLAISAYHKPEDMIVLPEIIHSFNPDYKMAFRHYSLHTDETILYAE